MKKKDFENLVESVRQAGRIRRGEAKPSRVAEFAPMDVETVRERLGHGNTRGPEIDCPDGTDSE